MHEMTIVLDIVDAVDDFADKNNIDEVKTVVLQIGGLTGIVPEYVEKCWEAATHKSRHLKGSNVSNSIVPGVGKCSACAERFLVPENEGICPKCGSREWTPFLGKDVQIKEILV